MKPKLKAFCELCKEPKEIYPLELRKDDLNKKPWCDIACKECGFVIATLSCDVECDVQIKIKDKTERISKYRLCDVKQNSN